MTTPIPAAWPADESWPDWRAAAACREADPELFFPEGAGRGVRTQVKTAKLICRGCPVSSICLGWALASGYEAGIWGGRTEDERRALRRPGRFPAGQQVTTGGSHDHYLY